METKISDQWNPLKTFALPFCHDLIDPRNRTHLRYFSEWEPKFLRRFDQLINETPRILLRLLFEMGLLWDFSVNRNRNVWEGLINWSMKPLEDFCASFLTWLKRKLQRPKRKKRHFSCRAGVKDHLQSLHDIESSSPKTKLNQSELCTTYLSWWNLFCTSYLYFKKASKTSRKSQIHSSLHDIESSSPKTKSNQSKLFTTYADEIFLYKLLHT